MKEIKFPLNATTRPILVGMMILGLWATIYCLINTTMVHSLGDARGVLLFGVRIGNVNRNFDPFFMGAFAALLTNFWRKIPPTPWIKVFKVSHPETLPVFGISISICYGFCFAERLSDFFWSLHCSAGFMTILLIIVMTPFGMKGSILSTAMCFLLAYINLGSIPAILFVSLVYLGKWIIWWVVNIIRHGFTGARNALRSTSDMSVVQQS